MLIKELTWNGLPIWPPHWVKKSPEMIQNALLKEAEILPITNLIKIDVTYAGAIISGLIFSNDEYRGTLYCKLKANIGKPLEEVANMELYF
jgi:hypothetical protein